jgi:hypothetical protein
MRQKGKLFHVQRSERTDDPFGRVSSATFSADSTLVAAGFTESYIRLWSTKGDKLRALRNDFDLSEVKDRTLHFFFLFGRLNFL